MAIIPGDVVIRFNERLCAFKPTSVLGVLRLSRLQSGHADCLLVIGTVSVRELSTASGRRSTRQMAKSGRMTKNGKLKLEKGEYLNPGPPEHRCNYTFIVEDQVNLIGDTGLTRVFSTRGKEVWFGEAASVLEPRDCSGTF